MIYVFKMYDLKELKDFSLFQALDMLSNNMDVSEFITIKEAEDFVATEVDEGGSAYLNEPEYVVIIDADKKEIIKKAYTLRLETKTFKSDEAIQNAIDAEAKKAEEEQKKRDEDRARLQKIKSGKK